MLPGLDDTRPLLAADLGRVALRRHRRGFPPTGGFTLVEMIVVVFLLALAMVGILGVFDASARINKSEQEVAEAQSAVRYGIHQMTRAIRMAGSGGLFVTQAVLNQKDPELAGITIGGGTDSFDNVMGASVTNVAGTAVPVRAGTDIIEIRGVINSPLLAFDLASGCGNCTGTVNVVGRERRGDALIGVHVNDDAAGRPQFTSITTYAASAATRPLLVIVSGNDDIHGGCSTPFGPQSYPQSSYNVGLITTPPVVAGAPPTITFTAVQFGHAQARELNNENPRLAVTAVVPITTPERRGGILDDLIFFIDNTDPVHPALAQGTRTGAALDRFDVVTLADDVEDLQFAYGVDFELDPSGRENGVTRISTVPLIPLVDTDLNYSTQVDGDEWQPNVPAEPVFRTVDFQRQQPVIDDFDFPHPGIPPAAHCPRLHGVVVSLVAKSKSPDPTYRAPMSLGFRIMNTPASGLPPYPDTADYATPGQSQQYRRRVQTIKINLRNFTLPA